MSEEDLLPLTVRIPKYREVLACSVTRFVVVVGCMAGSAFNFDRCQS